MVDFPGFRVAPGSRRGIIIDEAAGAFASAISAIEPIIARHLEELERHRAEQLDRSMIRDLQRAFRDFYRQRPRYAMLPVQGDRDEGTGSGDPDSRAANQHGPRGNDGSMSNGEEPLTAEASSRRDPLPTPEIPPTIELFPPGPWRPCA